LTEGSPYDKSKHTRQNKVNETSAFRHFGFINSEDNPIEFIKKEIERKMEKLSQPDIKVKESRKRSGPITIAIVIVLVLLLALCRTLFGVLQVRRPLCR
jgi:hypothetical protein